MRIALSVRHYLDNNAGAAGAVMALSKALQDQGHRVELLSLDDLPDWVARLSPPIGVRLQSLIFPWFVVRRMRGRLAEFDVVDLLSGDGWLLYFFINSWRPSAERPLLITHGQGLEHIYAKALATETKAIRFSNGLKSFFASLYDTFYGRYFRLWEGKLSYKFADVGLFQNQVDRAFAIEHFPMPEARARVSTNGIPDSMLGLEEPRRSSGMKLIVAQIGTYVVRKGVHYGAQALSDVMTRYSNIRVRFLGTGCSAGRVLSEFAPELRDRIEVLPRYERDELPRLLADCEIKLLPSLAEGFGMALVEAMACGLAPVSTMTPGPMSIVDPEVDGLLVPPKDSRALSTALTRLIDDEDLRFRIRRNAYRKAQRYSWEVIARQRVEIYQEFLDKLPTAGTRPVV